MPKPTGTAPSPPPAKKAATQPFPRRDEFTNRPAKERITPQCLEAEQAVIGALLMDAQAASGVFALVNHTDFYREIHRKIFAVVAKLHADNQPVDLITVVEELRQRDSLDEIGGTAYLTALIEACPSSLQGPRYAQSVLEASQLRQLLRAAESIQNAVYQKESPAEEISTLASIHLAELAQPQKTRLGILSLAEVLDQPEPKFIISGLLVKSSISLVTAKHRHFKSFIALDMALNIATGRNFHGLQTMCGPAVYVAAEGSAGIKKRAMAWLAYHDIETPTNFHVLNAPLQITDPVTRQRFADEIKAIKPAIIVLDTLARCTVGLDENSTGDMGQFADAIGALAQATAAHVMVIHHNNKLGDYRGSSSLPAAVDTHLSLERKNDTVCITVEKQKDFEEIMPILLEAQTVTINNGRDNSLAFRKIDTGNAGRFALSEMDERILKALAENFDESGATWTAWQASSAEAGASKTTFFTSQKKLLKFKAVFAVKGTAGEKGAKYAVTEDWGATSHEEENDC